MTSLFSSMTKEQEKLIEKRNELLDQQEALKVHSFRTDTTVLTDDDKKFDSLQSEIDAINAELAR